jgi:hypothetical protein
MVPVIPAVGGGSPERVQLTDDDDLELQRLEQLEADLESPNFFTVAGGE